MRVFGESLPISIGTAIPVEFMLVGDVAIPNSLIINVSTLIRNIQAAYGDDKYSLRPEVIAKDVIEDMGTIREHLSGKTNIMFYYNSAKSLTRILKLAIPAFPTTDKQKTLANQHSRAITILRREKGEEINMVDMTLSGDRKGITYLMTHYPTDLLNYKNFGNLKLLESHTGALKGKSEWNSKLGFRDRTSRIPFNKMSLTIFGDNRVLLGSYPAKVRDYIIDLAEEYEWTSATDTSKLMYCINKNPDKLTKDTIIKMF